MVEYKFRSDTSCILYWGRHKREEENKKFTKREGEGQGNFVDIFVIFTELISFIQHKQQHKSLVKAKIVLSSDG